MKILLIVDLQNDFVEGGALPILGGRALIPRINRLQMYFDLIVASRDWHPPNHCSFAENHPGKKPGDFIEFRGYSQILWPVHCVQDTWGAEFVPGLDRHRWAKIFSKGVNPNIDSYSVFFDNINRRSTGITEYFKTQGVTEVYIAGLATNYCVKFSALDAIKLGIPTKIIRDAIQGIDLHPQDSEYALATLQQAGAQIIQSIDLWN